MRPTDVTRIVALLVLPALFWGDVAVDERHTIKQTAKNVVNFVKDARSDLLIAI